jgi:hypothetical protein
MYLPDGPRMLRMKGGRVPLGTRRFVRVLSRPMLISGVTRDASGVALGGCTVHLFNTTTDTLQEVATSDANGAFTLSSILDLDGHYLVAIDPTGLLAGTTLNTLVGA